MEMNNLLNKHMFTLTAKQYKQQ